MSRMHHLVGCIHVSPLTYLAFVVTDHSLVKAQDHDLFYYLFLSGNSETSLMSVGVDVVIL